MGWGKLLIKFQIFSILARLHKGQVQQDRWSQLTSRLQATGPCKQASWRCLSTAYLCFSQLSPLGKIYSQMTETNFDTRCSVSISGVLWRPLLSRFLLGWTGKPLWYAIKLKPKFTTDNWEDEQWHPIFLSGIFHSR